MSLETNTWTTRSTMPFPGALSSHFCAARAREVYVMAGKLPGKGYFNAVNIFNVDSGDWRVGEFFLGCSLWSHK